MQGTIAQIIALTTYGNAFVAGTPHFNLYEFYPGNSTFRFCEYVRFVDRRPHSDAWEEPVYAPDPSTWFSVEP